MSVFSYCVFRGYYYEICMDTKDGMESFGYYYQRRDISYWSNMHSLGVL